MKLAKIGILAVNLFFLFTFSSNLYAVPGDLDTTFDGDGKTTTTINGSSVGNDVAIQSDGKIVVVGNSNFNPNDYDVVLARYNADGSLDSSFGNGGKVSVPETGHQFARCVAIQSDGKIITAGSVQTGAFPNYVSWLAVYRFNSDGSVDTTFSTGGRYVHNFSNSFANDAVIQTDGKIVIAASLSARLGAMRFNQNGTLDISFNSVGYNSHPNTSYGYAVALQSDGKIIVGGESSSNGSGVLGVWVRFNTNGTIETTGGSSVLSDVRLNDVVIQPDGKIVFAGTSAFRSGMTLIRFNADKTLDRNFGFQGKNGVIWRGVSQNAASSQGTSLVIQPDGRIVLGGYIFLGTDTRFGLARFNSNGFLDVGFGNGGRVETNIGNSQSRLRSIEMQTDGKIAAAGSDSDGNISSFALARYHGGGSNTLANRAPFDFDGDGRSEIAVIRPSTNTWYHFFSLNSSVGVRTFGTSGDIYAPADYDGDGRTDFAVYRPSTGQWWYEWSAASALYTFNVGIIADAVARPGDFDGDGRDDFILYSPSTGVWHRLPLNERSAQTPSNVTFGIPGDNPVSGDFDGDGKVDPAIFRPSTGDWWYLSSINNTQLAVRWGISTDIPVAADYDGDRKTDFAVYRPSVGVWYIFNSSNGSFTIMSFGLAEDKPVAADYDGDGKADIAVFRPSTGVWYLMRSTAGFTALQFGISTDIPTPNAFVP